MIVAVKEELKNLENMLLLSRNNHIVKFVCLVDWSLNACLDACASLVRIK